MNAKAFTVLAVALMLAAAASARPGGSGRLLAPEYADPLDAFRHDRSRPDFLRTQDDISVLVNQQLSQYSAAPVSNGAALREALSDLTAAPANQFRRGSFAADDSAIPAPRQAVKAVIDETEADRK